MGLSELISGHEPGTGRRADEWPDRAASRPAGGEPEAARAQVREEGGPRPPRVPPREVLAAAVRAGRRDWPRILAVAIAVSLVSSGGEIIVDHYVDPSDGWLSASASLCATGVSLLGTVLLSGFVCRLISAAERGGQPLSLPRLARSLPWRRLVVADVLVSLITVAGLFLLVIPGLAALTLLAVTGPLIEIEHQKVTTALRRSVALTRRHLWPVILLATIPLAVASELEAMAPEPHHAYQIAQFLVVRCLAEGIVEACIAVILVELCFRLIDAHPAAAPTTTAAQAAASAAATPPRDSGETGLPPTASGNRQMTT